MGLVYETTIGLLCAAALLTLVRIFRGPSEADQAVALDVLVVLIVAGVAVEIAWRREAWNLALLGSVALLGFLGTVSVARLLEMRSFDQPGEDPDDGDAPGGDGFAR